MDNWCGECVWIGGWDDRCGSWVKIMDAVGLPIRVVVGFVQWLDESTALMPGCPI